MRTPGFEYRIRPAQFGKGKRKGNVQVDVLNESGNVLLVVFGSPANVRGCLQGATRQLREELKRDAPVEVLPLDLPVSFNVAKASRTITLVAGGVETPLSAQQVHKVARYLEMLAHNVEASVADVARGADPL
jgi:hypothetical protein